MDETARLVITRIIVDLLGRSLKLAKDSERYKGKEKAVAIAAYVEITRAYNTALKTAELVGIVQPPNLKVEVTKLMRGNAFGTLDEDDFDLIVQSAFGTTTYEAMARRQELFHNQARILTVTQDMNSTVARALNTILKHPVLGPMVIPVLEEFAAKGKLLEKVNIPRGNPRKAGLVSAYKRKGFSEEKAYAQAELDLEHEDSANKSVVREPILTPQTPDIATVAAMAGVSEEEMQAAIDATAPTGCQDPGDIRARQRLKMWEEQDEQTKST